MELVDVVVLSIAVIALLGLTVLLIMESRQGQRKSPHKRSSYAGVGLLLGAMCGCSVGLLGTAWYQYSPHVGIVVGMVVGFIVGKWYRRLFRKF